MLVCYWRVFPPTVIKLYLNEEARKEDIQALLAFLAAASDTVVQEELLQLLLSLLTMAVSAGLGSILWTAGLPFLVLIRAESMAVRLLTIKVQDLHVTKGEH